MGTLIHISTGNAELEDDRAIITGAARGLGAAIPDAFRRFCADVLLVARLAENLRALGNRSR
jgi:NADP-dependent 3-hydroxy acid dehydrogenase YdfG